MSEEQEKVYEHEEEEEDEIITGKEIAEAIESRTDVERRLYGSSDETVCTWPEGYKPRQSLFSCLTCVPDKDTFAGVCLGCSTHCHAGHDLVELYTKRKFRCDCGNEKFGSKNKCQLYEEKSIINEDNIYNHNFSGKYCTCGDTFPGKLTETMYQCLMCEDWFHLSHLNIKADSVEWKRFHEDDFVLVCSECTTKYPFLSPFESAVGDVCFSSIQKSDDFTTNTILALKSDWRTRLCKCSKCQSLIEEKDCTFLYDEEDDLEKFEKENLECSKPPTDTEVVNEMVNIAGRDATIQVLKGFNELKQGLRQFFAEKRDNEVITVDDINSFFSQIKRPRLDPDTQE